MSARDAESGSSTYRGGSGRAGGLGNGGLGGGMGAGMGGGGAARNGGYGNRTGLTTGNTMFGGMAFGRPGGFALNSSAWGVRPQPKVTQGPLNPGLLGNPAPASVPGVNPVPEDVPMPPVQDPMSIYTTLTPPTRAPAPYPPTPYWNGMDGWQQYNTIQGNWGRNPGVSAYDFMDGQTGNLAGPQRYNPATSPGYDAYTSVYKNGPIPDPNRTSSISQNGLGGVPSGRRGSGGR